jgi:hypothetical protein
MLIYSIIFFSSLVLMVGMLISRFLYEKLHEEHVFHRVVAVRAKKVDAVLKKKFRKVRRFLKYFNKKTFALLVHFVIEEIEERLKKFADFIRSRLPH